MLVENEKVVRKPTHGAKITDFIFNPIFVVIERLKKCSHKVLILKLRLKRQKKKIANKK